MVAGAAARPVQNVCRVGTCGKPRRNCTEDNPRHKGQSEGERQDYERRRGADGKEVCAMKGECKQRACACYGHEKSCNTAAHREENALRENLPNNPFCLLLLYYRLTRTS
jgi:hypothetical protein